MKKSFLAEINLNKLDKLDKSNFEPPFCPILLPPNKLSIVLDNSEVAYGIFIYII
jgi:hypothetical protein